MVSPQTPGGGVGVAERVLTPSELDTLWGPDPKPEKLEDKLERAKSSLTIIENLSGYLAILMASTTVVDGEKKEFINTYLIRVDQRYIVSGTYEGEYMKSERQNGDPLLYIIVSREGGKYPVASLVPHEVCKLTDEEHKWYENGLNTDTGLTKIAKNMIRLLGERVDSFSFEDGRLILPENYANIKL